MRYYLFTGVMLVCSAAAFAQQQAPVNATQVEGVQQILKQQQQPGSAMQRGMDRIITMDPKTIEAAIGMGSCVHKQVGLDAMERLAKEGEAFDKEAMALCRAGQRDEASELQQQFAARMKRAGDYQKLQTCYDQYKAYLKDPALTSMHRRVESFEGTGTHICDS